ncbi:hypothetical protein K501DRAFT_274468 [Backusella circina FSU 941]|nr:hypothetical protein K501DRAFT_274468 [Backusella circina FSU 941]
MAHLNMSDLHDESSHIKVLFYLCLGSIQQNKLHAYRRSTRNIVIFEGEKVPSQRSLVRNTKNILWRLSLCNKRHRAQVANHPFPLNKNCGLETSVDVRSKADRRCAMTISLTVRPAFRIPGARPSKKKPKSSPKLDQRFLAGESTLANELRSWSASSHTKKWHSRSVSTCSFTEEEWHKI